METPKKILKLTPGQQRAVDVRNANVLVAAAAGSGKTKVLVDRILGKVTDKDNPVNVDDFLVVTFTNAAAAQMREKIREKLAEALEENPESEHLMLQQLLVNRADICTIDSFCLKLVRENFNLLDIDSSFTIGDPGMMELVKNDVLTRLFERLYDEEDVDFKALVDIFGNKNQEEDLKKAVSDIYNKASSYPVPEIWLNNAKNAMEISDEEQLIQLPWIRDYVEIAKAEIGDVKCKIDIIYDICSMEGGPDKYISTIDKDLEIVNGLANATNYHELHARKPDKWPGLTSCKGESYDKDLIKQAQTIRNEYKDLISKKIIPNKSASELVEELNHIATYIIPLINLTKTFMEEYMQEKKQRRMLEFADVEHMAHTLVCQGYTKDGRPIPTELAKNISLNIAEIYIDEYQDSNYLQEDILGCVSGNHRGEPNMFMVGDVKQSIYRFRMARPELFIEKYNSYKEEGDNIKILLNNNFRSRKEVLLPVNYFFYQLMGKDLGDIVYDEKVSLIPTMEFPEPGEEIEQRISKNTEVMILNLEAQDDDNDGQGVNSNSASANSNSDDMENMKNLELEAHMIAGRIKELVSEDAGMYVYDENAKMYRKASYKDIVILTRSMKGVGEQFYNVLNSYGIPTYVSDPKGYFDAVEIKVVMSLLGVVDNSKQDIPLAAVLLSPMGKLNESELAKVCDYSKYTEITNLYDKCQYYILENNDLICDKLQRLFDIIAQLKSMKNEVSISQLIWNGLQMTNYYTYVSAMPMGSRRKANLDMLLEKADEFEEGYYKGLFNFLRYVDKLKVNQADFGEASVVSDDEDVVRIMTMHSSKGLEYPIVFVSALGKQFNKRENKDKLIINSDYYLAMTYLNREKRYSKDTFIRDAFKEINSTEGIAEELRVLYVALTRAKEKLIITGHTKRYSNLINKFANLEEERNALLPYSTRKKALTFIELIMASMIRFNSFSKKYNVEDLLKCIVVDRDMLSERMAKESHDAIAEVGDILDKLEENWDQQLLDDIKKKFDYTYPYMRYSQIKSKMSVSDIKKQKAYNGMGYDDSEFEYKALSKENFEDDSDALKSNENDYAETQKPLNSMPEEQNKKLDGAMRGTIVHKCMELIDFASLDGEKDLYQFALNHKKSLKDKGIFDDVELRAINCKKVANMLKSNLGQRMIKAALRGELFKEQQFSIGFLASQVYNIDDDPNVTDDTIIVQGIVDGYFVEDGQIVVMDYKTDACDEETLIGRYKAQLEYYGDTLAKLRGMPIKEKVMYSFSMEKEVPV
ncbi:MAG: helicase-exonuclease AddAB subunit AddA [Lachnospiraceae bacterium]|nr:helicase-exonuclease AddAB subunit AddA [Lachnospiraceae bacterium]